jgi:flavin reductase
MSLNAPTPALAVNPGADDARVNFRNAMARMGAAVHIVTTDGPGGRAGFAATAVCSVSDNPPTLLVCLNRTSSAYLPLKENGVLCVNVLSADHADLSQRFGGKTPIDERFAAATWSPLETGCPALDDALVCFDCRVASIADGHTHDILICEVLTTVQPKAGQSLIYLDRKYHAL